MSMRNLKRHQLCYTSWRGGQAVCGDFRVPWERLVSWGEETINPGLITCERCHIVAANLHKKDNLE